MKQYQRSQFEWIDIKDENSIAALTNLGFATRDKPEPFNGDTWPITTGHEQADHLIAQQLDFRNRHIIAYQAALSENERLLSIQYVSLCHENIHKILGF